MKKDKTIFIEIKNKHNTLNASNASNASSRESTINKLKKIKKLYPKSLCLIGIINGKKYKKIISENPEIWEYSCEELFNLVLNDSNYYQTINNYIMDGLKIGLKNIKI